jgi:uncharacterized membrane protein
VAALAAGAALVVVSIVGLIVAKQLSRVPENTIKLAVGVMLTSFGLFWVGEGSGVHWPGDDLFLLALIGLTSLVTLVDVVLMRRVGVPAVNRHVAVPVHEEVTP